MPEITKGIKAANRYDKILLIMTKNRKKFVKDQAKSKGISVNAYLNILIEEDMYVN